MITLNARPTESGQLDAATTVPSGAHLLTGAEAAAHAMGQIDPDVVPVYPITPQTPIIQTFARFVADGLAGTEIVNVESEHSAMSAAVGAALAGGRTMTATASQGLALMIEVLYIAASSRAPIVMAIGNRALSGPINIHCDHSDSMLARDSGAIQIFAENAQEAYDYMLMAPRIAEHPDVLLPVLICQDGFTITHSAEPVFLADDDAVNAFVGAYRIPHPLLDLEQPTTQGPFAMPDAYFELKKQQVDAMDRARNVIADVAFEFDERWGRGYGLIEPYRMRDADRALVLMGSAAGTAKDVVDEFREAGERVGLVKVRAFRPFPAEAIRDALNGVPAVAVLDRALSFGSHAPLHVDVAASLYASPRSRSPGTLRSYVYGLGGRDLMPEHLAGIIRDLNGPAGPRPVRYPGLES